MFLIDFTENYKDCLVGKLYRCAGSALSTRKEIGQIIMPKRFPLTHKGNPYKLEGLYKVSYTFEDGYYSPCLTVNRRPFRLRLLLSEDRKIPAYAAATIYCKPKKADIGKVEWTERVRMWQVDNNTCSVRWDSCRQVPEYYFEPEQTYKPEVFDDEDEWV